MTLVIRSVHPYRRRFNKKILIWRRLHFFWRYGCQSCSQIEISPDFGSFSELYWVLLTKTKKFCGIFKTIGSFSGAFLGASDKYVELLCYFGSFFNVLVSFGSFLGRFDQFWNSTEFSVLFSVLFPEKLQIRENSRISGAGNSTALMQCIILKSEDLDIWWPVVVGSVGQKVL